jgi:hypothetical protein
MDEDLALWYGNRSIPLNLSTLGMKYNINLLDNKIPGTNVLDPVSDLVDTELYYLHPRYGSLLFYQEKQKKVIEIKE